jgi:hypothetical protein
MNCPGCQAGELLPMIKIEAVPTHCNVPFTTREAALGSPLGTMDLGHCPACGLIYNMAFDPALIPYSAGYENSLHFSAQFDDFARELAHGLVERYGLHGNKLILEVGCGRGDFLCMLCEGGNQGIGFDPSYAGHMPDRPGATNVSITSEPYGDRCSPRPIDLVCCRHTLEHVSDPGDFIEAIRDLIQRSSTGTPVYFEVPNAMHMLESDAGVWDITYEHCSYFSASALAALFVRTGFSVQRIAEAFHGQFLSLEGRLVSPNAAATCSTKVSTRWSETVGRFRDRFNESVSRANQDLKRWTEAGQRAVIWGGGSKGTTFLNTVPSARCIEYVVDINPHKQGLFIAGTGQRIVPPAFLREFRPGVVILMNAIYEDEVRRQLAELDLGPEVHAV